MMKYLLAFLICFVVTVSSVWAGVPDDLQAVSVTIKAGNAQGSGTLVTRKVGDTNVTFVWTAAHVVAGLRTVRNVVVDGATKTLIEYKDAEIVQEIQQDGRRIGEVKYDAKVIKVSDADYGEDLALLMVRRKDAYPLKTTAIFYSDTKLYVPAIGTELVHVGSLLGQFGANSFTTGVVSQTGRTLPGKGASVNVYDQVTCTAFPGSSGGGVFLKSNGEYVGMLTRGVMQLQGFNFIVPVRRIHAWAVDNKTDWAIDLKVKVPTLKEIESLIVEDSATVNSHGAGIPDGPPEPGHEPCISDVIQSIIDSLRPYYSLL